MFDERIKEIIFYQTNYDRVKYIAEELDKPISISVKNFFKLLHESGVIPANIFEFNKAFDSFETIKLNLEKGHWIVVSLDNNETEIKEQVELDIKEGLNTALLNKNNDNNLTLKIKDLYGKAINTRDKMFDKMINVDYNKKDKK